MKRITDPGYAGFWRRVGAAFMDSFFFSLVYGLVIGVVFGKEYLDAPLFTSMGFFRTFVMLVVTVTLWVNFLGTPGKLLLGCQVVDADTFEVMTVRQAVIRFLSYSVSMLPFMLGFLWIAWDPRKQGFHDKIANTVVLYNANIEADDESYKSLGQLMSEVR